MTTYAHRTVRLADPALRDGPDFGRLPGNLVPDYSDLMSNSQDARPVTDVLLAYQPGETQPCGIAVIRRVSK